MSAAVTRPDRRQVWRHISVDRTDLPMPQEIQVENDGFMALSFERYDELVSWTSALADVQRVRDRLLTDEGGKWHSYFTFGDFLGYHGYATCHEDAPATVLKVVG
jgi:hypothetical protein